METEKAEASYRGKPAVVGLGSAGNQRNKGKAFVNSSTEVNG